MHVYFNTVVAIVPIICVKGELLKILYKLHTYTLSIYCIWFHILSCHFMSHPAPFTITLIASKHLALHSDSLWQVSALTQYAAESNCTLQHSFLYNVRTYIRTVGNPTPFLYTPTSLLPEHSVLTDVQQATGRNGQLWITCRSGGQGTRPKIWIGSELVVNSSTTNSATIWLGTQLPNGLYHCLSGQSQREYFSVFLTHSGKVHV